MADVIDAIIAEALNQGPNGMAAVAHVIATRAAQLGISPDEVVNQPGQFTGVSNPGRVVAQSMGNPSVRAAVQNIWNGVQDGSIANPFPGADHYHTDRVSPDWASSFNKLGQQGAHIFYASGKPVPSQVGSRTEVAMPTPSEWRPTPQQVSAARAATNAGGGTGGTDWLTYSNQGATRSQPISSELQSAMSFLSDMGIRMDVYSGGQDASGPNRVGSRRHDHGGAADVMFYKDGRMLDWNNEADLPILSDIVSRARTAGVTGIGAGNDYMGAGRFHVGFGAPAVWGADGRAANAPQWLRTAYYGAAKPAPVPPRNIPNPPRPGVPPVLAAGGAGIGGFWRNPLGAVTGAFGGIPPILASANSANVQRNVTGAMLSTVAGRTMAANMLLPSNIGAAPSVSQGFGAIGRGGSHAYAVTNGGSAPVTLQQSSGSSSHANSSSDPWAGTNTAVYRANAAVLGGNGFNQANIDRALASGATLYRPR